MPGNSHIELLAALGSLPPDCSLGLLPSLLHSHVSPTRQWRFLFRVDSPSPQHSHATHRAVGIGAGCTVFYHTVAEINTDLTTFTKPILFNH